MDYSLPMTTEPLNEEEQTILKTIIRESMKREGTFEARRSGKAWIIYGIEDSQTPYISLVDKHLVSEISGRKVILSDKGIETALWLIS